MKLKQILLSSVTALTVMVRGANALAMNVNTGMHDQPVHTDAGDSKDQPKPPKDSGDHKDDASDAGDHKDQPKPPKDNGDSGDKASKGNNGFGNGGKDGVPGNSGKQVNTR